MAVKARYHGVMNAASLVAPLGPDCGLVTLPGADGWMQGRTLYGGASALVAYVAAMRALPDLPPLRSGQVAFVGPVGGEVEPVVTMVRQGRNVTQVRVDLLDAADSVGLAAFFLFGAARPANADYPAPTLNPLPALPDEDVPADRGPEFIRHNFKLRRAQDQRGRGGAPVIRRWLRLKHASGLDPMAELVLLGDTLPPGSVRAMQRPGPISSINWHFNMLDPAPVTNDGWWLAETAGEYGADGFSSERLRLWNRDGRLVMSGMQCVALFG